MVNELIWRRYDIVASDITEGHSGIYDDNNAPASHISYVHLDIADRDSVKKALREYDPNTEIYCDAWTAVNLAEKKSREAYLINAQAIRNVAEACHALDIRLMYISIDYVFDGSGENLNDIPVTTAEYSISKARSLFNSKFDKIKLSGKVSPLPDWRDAVHG